MRTRRAAFQFICGAAFAAPAMALAQDGGADGDIGPAEIPGPGLVELVPGERLSDADRAIDPATGMQRSYAILPAEERARGFVRPVRLTYTHRVCGTDTSMSQEIAETLARNPSFYNSAYCVHCRVHRPLPEFVWTGTNEQVGS